MDRRRDPNPLWPVALIGAGGANNQARQKKRLDALESQQSEMESPDEIEALRREFTRLRSENEELRRRLRAAPSVKAEASPSPKERRRTVETRTRYQAVFARHQVACAKSLDKEQPCTCRPSFYGKVWDAELGNHRRTERRSTAREAKRLREELLESLRRGRMAGPLPRISLSKAQETFIADCRAGIALNNRGEPYKPKAITNLDSSLRTLPEPIRRRPLAEVTGAELQEAIDDYRRRRLSSSRIRSIICAVRSLYTWATQRGRTPRSPATNLRLPALRYRERTRIAKPAEFAQLLEALRAEDALPWALAGYATARHQEIQILEWPDVDFQRNTLRLAGDEAARKSDAALRTVPMVGQLSRRLFAEWVRQGEPKSGRVCPPRRRSRSGLVCLNTLSKRVKMTWLALGLEPIGLQDSRHTAATWLDHAGVSPKVISTLMGHKTPAPGLRFGAAPITLRRYTHVLDGELERAGELLSDFIAFRETEEGAAVAAPTR